MPKEQMVVRTWLRDLSTNEMYLGAACLNLKHNGVCAPDVARERLLLGETLYTRHAHFKLADQGDTYHAPNQQAAGRVNPNGTHADHPHVVPSRESLLGL